MHGSGEAGGRSSEWREPLSEVAGAVERRVAARRPESAMIDVRYQAVVPDARDPTWTSTYRTN